MGLSLKKGERINLRKEVPELKHIMVGLGWKINSTNKETENDFNLDVSVIMLDNNGKALGEEYVIFYNNQKSPCGAVIYGYNNSTYKDDEKIFIDLEKIPEEVRKLVFIVNIYKAEERKQNFSMIDEAYIRIIDIDTDKEIVRYDLINEFSTELSVNFGELYKKDGEWRFRAVGMGQKEGLAEFFKQYGFTINQ